MANKESPYPGGRGKTAPYQTEMYRIPTPLKSLIKNLALEFKFLQNSLSDPKGEKLILRIEAAISSSGSSGEPDIKNELEELRSRVKALEKENGSLRGELATLERQAGMEVASLKNDLWLAQEKIKLQEKSEQKRVDTEAIAILRSALELKANAGGAIKAKIEQAFPELARNK